MNDKPTNKGEDGEDQSLQNVIVDALLKFQQLKLDKAAAGTFYKNTLVIHKLFDRG